ncbi:hypothetical protein MMC26_005731 [Xylographa opegraphella]|nr:hypothetical protein [Xylographa opegraphella]
MSTVSAQSAFWAVVALALNTACQPAGSVLSSPAAHSGALRTSPIICVADALVTLSTFVALLVQRHGVRQSARAVLHWRFHENGAEPEEAAKIEQGWFRALVFVLGALPQMVKVVGLQGVPWTQALCSAYLASFAVVELLVYLAGEDRDDVDRAIVQPGFVVTLGRIFRGLGGVVQTALWIYCMAEVLNGLIPPSSGDGDLEHEDDLVVIAIVPFVTVSYIVLLVSIWSVLLCVWFLFASLVQPALAMTPSLPLIVVTCLVIAAGNTAMVFVDTATKDMHHFVLPGCVIWATLLLAVPGMLATSILHTAAGRTQPIKNSRLFLTQWNWPAHYEPLFFFLMNAAALLLSYLRLYDPQGTVKPAWTEWLG